MRLWDPFYEMVQLQDRTNRLLREGLGRSTIKDTQLPAVDVYEEGDKLVVEAALPNFDKKDIEANLSNNGLEIKAQHTAEREDKKRSYLVRETTGSSFYRYINLPAGALTDQAKADFENGVLRVEVPLEHQAEPKKLEISENQPIDSKSSAK
jgi:HSP20 family protein